MGPQRSLSRPYPAKSSNRREPCSRLNCFQCRERDSNPHALRRTILSRMRLPIPPSRHSGYNATVPKKPKVLVLVGPTSSGKSALAVELARTFSGEVVSADSRQVYKGLDIGTGKMPKREMRD